MHSGMPLHDCKLLEVLSTSRFLISGLCSLLPALLAAPQACLRAPSFEKKPDTEFKRQAILLAWHSAGVSLHIFVAVSLDHLAAKIN